MNTRKLKTIDRDVLKSILKECTEDYRIEILINYIISSIIHPVYNQWYYYNISISTFSHATDCDEFSNN